MTMQHHPGEDNIFSLKQGVDLIRRLDAETFAGPPEDRSAIGSQFRHCIDFYDCFLSGMAHGRVDYNERERDRRIATDPAYAVERIERIVAALTRLTAAELDADLDVRIDRAAPVSDVRDWCRSTVLRELQFLFSHTIHHYALIANLLTTHGVEFDRDFSGFGVAPSTLTYWKQTDRPQP